MSVTALRRGLAAACLLACVSAPAEASAASKHDPVEASIVSAINQARASYGLPALRTSSGMARAADAHSKTMLRHNTMSHGAFGSRVRKYVRVKKVGENLAWMSQCDANGVVQMWLNSAPHRRVMLSRSFRRVGVGKRASSNTCFVTADFGTAK